MTRDSSRGELLFSWVCFVLLSSVDSLTWTGQPTNPTVAIKGQDVSLTWRYSLTADELTKSNTYFYVAWRKFNASSLTYDRIAFRSKAVGQPAVYNEPIAPRIVVDRATGTDFASLKIIDVRTDDEGRYKIEISVEFPGTVIAADDEVNLTVSVPSEIVYVSPVQDICEGSLVTLFCNATGIPTPSITWTRVADNGTDSTPLPAVDGAYVIIYNITRSSNGFTYRCTATNGAGTVNRTVQVTVRYPPSVDRIVNSSNTVIEGHPFNMTCEVSGDPMPKNYTWISVDTGQRHYGSILAFPNLSRSDTGQYRCEADNRCGKGSRVQFIDVLYQPRITTISGNKTVNDTMPVTLNCTADGNPSPSISWTRLSDNSPVNMPFTVVGKQAEGFYRCTANNGVGRSDSQDFFISVENYRPTNTSLATDLVGNITDVNTSFNLICSAQAKPAANYRLYKGQESLTNTANGPYPTSVNTRVKQVTYRCTPFNYYGDGPTEEITVTVHYDPANVTLVANTTENKDCSSLLRVNFTCVASEANPAVEKYTLFVDGEEPSVSSRGTWIKEISKKGKHVYGCRADHPEGNVTSSNNVTVTYNVPAQVFTYVINDNKTLKEGGDVSLYCNASGFPDSTVTWLKVGVNTPFSGSSWLNFTNISRYDKGNYICVGINTCGKENSSVININVLYNPANVTLVANTTENKDCSSLLRVNFSCVASEANPAVEKYTLFVDGEEPSVSSSGTWIKEISKRGKHVYGCRAHHPEGNVTSSNNVAVTYNVPAQVSTNAINGNQTPKEGGNVSLYCNVSGFPDPNIAWLKVGVNTYFNQGPWLHFTNISRYDRGNYICIGNNTCGKKNSSVINIDVLYPPFVTDYDQTITVTSGTPTNLLCPVYGYPEPNITWYKGDDISGRRLHTGKEYSPTPTESEDGWYTCFAENSLGNITASLRLVVEPVKTTTEPTDGDGKGQISVEVTLITENGASVNFIPAYNDLRSAASKAFVNKFVKEMNTTYENVSSYKTTEVTALRKGSVIVSFILFFTTPVTINEGLAKLNESLIAGTFGSYETGALKIIQHPTSSPSATPTTKSTSKPTDDDKEDPLPWAVIGGAAGGGFVLIIAIGVAVWYMNKRRKYRKDTKNGLVYADLGDFGKPRMPPVSTSPEALPPVNRPPAYEGTQYADITDFLKGDATLPKEGNSQGIEMQPQATPPANGNSQGNEVKLQGANKDESGLQAKESNLQVDPVFFLNLGYTASSANVARKDPQGYDVTAGLDSPNLFTALNPTG